MADTLHVAVDVDQGGMISERWHKGLVNEAIQDTTTVLSHDAGFATVPDIDMKGQPYTHCSAADMVRWLLTPAPPALVMEQIAKEIGCNLPEVVRIACEALAIGRRDQENED